jgi:sugar O-acyltransferase (sialic acid O-acetyltransferase NeuD family)
MSLEKEIALIGYSGHAFVVADIFASANKQVTAYCDFSEKEFNPYGLNYLGQERDEKAIEKLRSFDYFIAIGDNLLREKIYRFLQQQIAEPVNAIHATAIISGSASLEKGIMVGPGAIINAQVKIGTGVICNSGSIIEHECVIGDFAHIAPGTVLGGNVKVGKNSFIGAGAVVKPGTVIGDNVVVGAGAVVIRDIANNLKVVGNPSRIL